MAGRKRASDDSGPSTRASKSAKTDNSATPVKAGKGGKRGPKTTLAMSAFMERASPMYLNITETSPSAASEGEDAPAASADPGHIASLTLEATSFSTGSYGWKGTQRFVIELPNPEGGEKEKVHVMMNINATVIGSKNVKEVEKETKENEVVEEDAVDEGSDKDKANGE